MPLFSFRTARPTASTRGSHAGYQPARATARSLRSVGTALRSLFRGDGTGW